MFNGDLIQVILECCGVSQPLFTIIGACQGLEVKFDSEAIPFGSVTLGSSSTRKLMMSNDGDIGTSFSWNMESFKPAFSISPHKGYISPGMVVAFEITFRPTEVNQDIRRDVSMGIFLWRRKIFFLIRRSSEIYKKTNGNVCKSCGQKNPEGNFLRSIFFLGRVFREWRTV